jgi:hypothetical protein
MKEIRYPELRKELVEHLQALSDLGYQQRVWIGKGAEGSVQHDEFDYVVHFLYDDTQLAESPHATIGWILCDASEAELIAALVARIEAIFQKYGTDLTDAQYIRLPEWDAVVGAARIARDAISQ